MFLVIKMLITEFRKILTNKIFLFVVAVVLIINGVLVFENAFNTDSTRNVYNEYAGQALHMDIEECDSYIKQELDEVEVKMSNLLQSDEIDYEMVSLLSIRHITLNEIMQEISRNRESNETNETLLANLEKAAKKSKNEWEAGVYKKQYVKYSELGPIAESYVPLRFTKLFLDCFWSDVLILLVICISVYIMTAYEKRKNYDVLIKTTKNSNKDYVMKVLAVLLLSVIIIGIVYIERGLILAANTVVPSLGAPAQLISVYCPYKLSIFSYILIYVALKMLFFVLMASFCFLIFVVVKHDLIALTGIAIVNVLFALLNMLIGENSAYSIIRTLNPYSLLNTESFLDRYDFINVFGSSIPVIAITAAIVAVLSVLMLRVSLILYGRSSKNTELSISVGHNKYIKSTNMLGCEIYNAFRARGGVVFLLLIAAMFFVVNKPVDTRFYSAVDYLTDRYSKDYEGIVSKETFDNINERYEAMVVSTAGNNDNVFLTAMSRIREYANYLEANDYKYYISNRGFDRLTCLNIDYNRRYMLQVSATMLLSCLFLLQMFGIDISADNLLLVNSTKNRAKSVKCRRLIAFVMLLVTYFAFVLPELVKILNTFGYDYINAPAACSQHLSGIPAGISILDVIILKYAMVIPGGIVYMYISEKLLKQIKNELGVAVIIMIIVMLPVVLWW